MSLLQQQESQVQDLTTDSAHNFNTLSSAEYNCSESAITYMYAHKDMISNA